MGGNMKIKITTKSTKEYRIPIEEIKKRFPEIEGKITYIYHFEPSGVLKIDTEL
jgi:hypothetical protein